MEGVGFGFDPKTSDYKVITSWTGVLRMALVLARTHLYNLSGNSWRQIESVVTAKIDQLDSYGVLFNGAFHWHATFKDKDGGYYETIVAFHMSDEMFEYIPVPDICSYRDGHCKSLAVLNDSLALI